MSINFSSIFVGIILLIIIRTYNVLTADSDCNNTQQKSSFLDNTVAIILFVAFGSYSFFMSNVDRDTVSNKRVTQYINHSTIITITVPARVDDNDEFYYINTTYNRYSRTLKTMSNPTFYEFKYNKYLMLVSFCGFDRVEGNPLDKCYDRSRIVRDGGYFRVRANQTQWHDPHYGTAENPMPVFGFELITTLNGSAEQQQVIEQKKAQFDVADEVNYLFVQQYLTHFVSEEELKKLFDN